MKVVFADTLYWVAIIKVKDKYAETAKQARDGLGNVRLLTTDEVLTEFLNVLSNAGEHLRRQAARLVRAILNDPNVTVVPQSRDSFLRGVELYEERLDKEYSLTDCISMNAMRSQSVSEILTHDHHFTQEGFKVLIATEEQTR